MISPARAAALTALRDINTGRRDLPAALAQIRPTLQDDRDRALAADLVTGTLRWQRQDEEKKRLDDQVQGLSENPELPGNFEVVYIDQERLVTQLSKTPEAWSQDPRNEIRVWDLTTGQPVTRPFYHWGRIGSAIFSEGGRFLATGALDGSARVWSVETSEPITPQIWHGQAVVPRALSRNGKLLVTSAPRATEPPYQSDQEPGLRIWDFGSDGGRSAREWTLLAQVISGRRIDSTGDLAPLEPRDLGTVWELLQAETPPPGDEREVKDWHKKKAAQCREAGYWLPVHWHLDRLLALEPDNLEYQRERAQALGELGQLQKAQEELKQLIAKNPGDLRAQAQLAATFSGLDNPAGYQAACKSLEQLLEKADSFADRALALRIGLFTEKFGLPANTLKTWAESNLAQMTPEDPARLDVLISQAMAKYRDKEYQAALDQLNQILLGHYPPGEGLAELLPEPLPPSDALAQKEPALPRAIDYGYRRYSSEKCPPDIPRVWFLLALAHHQLSEAEDTTSVSEGIDHAREAQQWHAETVRFTADLLDSRFRALGSSPVPRWIRELSWERRLELLLLEREVRATLPKLVITPIDPAIMPMAPQDTTSPSLEKFFPESKNLFDTPLPPPAP
jgi:tetratricopeptide (TPR) repeat protein